ncbi:unnamed protein product [Ceutorhynchus assimilis]|uniref:Uncharacterized protein n=1 Tax=Ceutorhynchus assimilis TaxID=467358 RepID=A0A9N9Q8Q9_9CUCU|nr:unnamed protein product [Ceutorhynchus assimilis]
MESLIRLRGAAKSRFTRIQDWFNRNVDLVTEVQQFETRLYAVDLAFEKFCQIQEKNDQTNDVTDEIERGMCEDAYYDISSKLKPKTDYLKNDSPVAVTNPTISHIQRLQLNIPVFSRDITTWHGFYELFKNFIENDTSLSNIGKLIYLKSYLKGLIFNLQLAGDNFNVALNILKGRYDNELNIIYAYIKNLIEAPSTSKGNSTSLRELVTFLKQNMEGLKNLGVNEDQWDYIT